MMGTRTDGADHLVGFGGREDEHHMVRRFLDNLQQRVETLLGDHVRLVKNENLIAIPSGGESGALSQFTGVIDAIVTGRVDFHHVDGTWTASGEVLATGAFPAWMRGRPLGAVDAPREDTRGTGLTAATRPGKQVRMRELAAVEGPHQRNSDLILTDDPLKRVRSITSIQCKCHKLQPIATRLFPGVFPYCPHYLRTHRGLAQMVPPQRRLRTRQRQSLACRPKDAGQAGSAQADSPVR